MVAVGRERQAHAHVLLRAVAQAGEGGDVAGVVAAVGFRLVGGVAAVGAQAAVVAAAQRQAQLVGLDGAAQVEGRAVVVAVGVVALCGAVQRDLADPFLAGLARDDVDHPAHGVRAVQRVHRAAHDFNAFDGGHGRNEVGVHVAKAVGPRARAVLVQPLAVNQYQGVVAGQATDADVHAACLAAAFNRHAFHVGHRIGQVVERLGFKLFARDHGNGRGRVLDFLLEAGSGDHHGIQLRNAQGVFHGAVGRLCVGRAGHGDGDGQGQQAERRKRCGANCPEAGNAFLSRHKESQGTTRAGWRASR
ncbi:hypothetical protein D3C73_954150 [compost metagenome]